MDLTSPLSQSVPERPKPASKGRGGKRPNTGGARPGAGRPALREKAQVVQLTVGAAQVTRIRAQLQTGLGQTVSDKELKAAIRQVAYQALFQKYGRADDNKVEPA